jgi:hypothetical protein
MKNILTISLVAFLAISSSVFAQEAKKYDNVKDAFANGKISGNVILYAIQKDNTGGIEDSGFLMNSISLNYDTANFYGLNASLGFKSNHKLLEKEEGDYDDDAPTAILNIANLKYTNDYFSVVAGRQKGDLEWMSDYHESYLATITAVTDVSIVFGYSNKIAVADADDSLSDYAELGEEGVSVVDVKYAGLKGLVLNTYY